MVIIPDKEPYIQHIDGSWYGGRVAQLSMLRLDVLHHEVSGNKWYKLKHNVAHCIGQGINTILTFGGAYSNHLVATAALAQMAGLKSIGIIKGTYAQQTLTPTLESCERCGMRLHFVSHEDYALKTNEDWLVALSEKYGKPYIIPEGGANSLGVRGTEDIATLIPGDYTHVAVSVGTGTTMAGLVRALPPHIFIAGFAPMKGGAYLQDEIKQLTGIAAPGRYTVYDDWHFGGFGKHTPKLIEFMNGFYTMNNIPLDMVYTAKMMYGLREQVHSGIYAEDAKILCIHTGGLQGNRSIQERLVY